MRLAEKCSKTACLQAKRLKRHVSAPPALTQGGFPRLSNGKRRFGVSRETPKRAWGR